MSRNPEQPPSLLRAPVAGDFLEACAGMPGGRKSWCVRPHWAGTSGHSCHPVHPCAPPSVTCTRICRAQTLFSLWSRSHSTGWWGDRQDAKRAVFSVPPAASSGTPAPLARMLVLHLKLVCASPQILNSFRSRTMSLTYPISSSMPGP